MLRMQEMTFPGFKFQKFSQTPPFMRGILATHVAFSYCYPPLIYYLTERSLFQKMPPTGKSLKKALVFVDAMFSISGINSTGLIILISTHSYVRKHSFQCDSNKQYSRLSRGMADTIRDDPYRPIQYK